MKIRAWAACLCLVAACSSSPKEEGVARLSIEPQGLTLLVGAQHALDVRAWDSRGRPYTGAYELRFTSDAPEVATVSSEGVVEAHAPGVARIRARVGSVSAAAEIRVEQAGGIVIRIDPPDEPLFRGGEIHVTAHAEAPDGTPLHGLPFTWSVSDPEILEVWAEGRSAFVRGLSPGQATLRAAVGAVAAEVEIEVRSPPAELRLNLPERMRVGERLPFAPEVLDEGGNPIEGLEIYVFSSSLQVVQIESEEIVAVGVGHALVVGIWETLRVEEWIEVLANVHTIRLQPDEVEAWVGDSIAFDIEIRDEKGQSLDVPVNWSADPEDSLVRVGPQTVTVLRGGEIRLRLQYADVHGEAVIHAKAVGEFVSLQSGESFFCGLNEEGTILCYGVVYQDGEWRPGTDAPFELDAPAPFVSFALGHSHLCALTAEGIAYCMGSNGSGQLGTGDSEMYEGFVQVDTPHRFESIYAGNGYTCAITDAAEGDNTYCWGDGRWGKLGNGSQANSYLPTPIPGFRFETLALSRGQALEASATCGIEEGGRVLCWGNNEKGQLGSNIPGDSFTPTPVYLVGRFVDVAIVSFFRNGHHGGHGCAVREDGAIFCWGANESGQVAQFPEPILWLPSHQAGADWARVTVSMHGGFGLSCATKKTGEASCWGSATVGWAFGSDMSQEHVVPTPIGAGMKWKSLDLSPERTCGISRDGKAYCWGGLVPGEAIIHHPTLLRGQAPSYDPSPDD